MRHTHIAPGTVRPAPPTVNADNTAAHGPAELIVIGLL